MQNNEAKAYAAGEAAWIAGVIREAERQERALRLRYNNSRKFRGNA